jgi:hypothetical protein
MSDKPNLGQLISGYWISQAVYAAAKLGLSDLLHEGPRTAEELAAKTGTLPDPLFRLLRALASVGVYQQQADGRFALTPLAEDLRDVPGSARAMAIMSGEEHYHAWGELMYSLKTGQPAFDKVYGKPVFDWLSQHPEQAAIFDQAMVSIHGRETNAMLDAYDFSGYGTVADIGGGNGSVLRGILQRHPTVRGMLCDLPGVLERAEPSIVADGLAGRVHLVPTDFFVAVPPGADAYLMRHIIHDWTDEQSRTILNNIRQVIAPSGRVLIVESVIPPGNEPFFGKLLDLNMLVMPGGKERSEAEYRELLASAGFRLDRVVPTATEISVLEASPV